MMLKGLKKWRKMMGKIVKPTKEALKRAGSIIREGGLVVFPTETVYGLGANAFDKDAVSKIFDVKKRPRLDPLIVHIANLKDIKRLCLKVGEKVELLIRRYWPGPLTLVLQKSSAIPDIVTAGLENVAIRMPSHPIALRFIKEAGVPIAAPSANLFGHLSPTTTQDIQEEIKEEVDLIIDGGRCLIGVESTVLELETKPVILRPGGLPIEEIEQEIGKVTLLTLTKRPRSPGQLSHHYSPRTPLKLLKNDRFDIPRNLRVGLLALKQPREDVPFKRIEVLSKAGDLREATSNLFPCLHRLDRAGLDIIYAEPVPEIGLGIAIMDRLRKAEGIKD